MSAAAITARDLGVCFWSDRQQRPLTLVMTGLRRRVDRSWGLRGLSLQMRRGEGVALIGASGSGKTTLLRAMAGVYPADAGSVEVEGPIAALLSTESGLISNLTGRENAELLSVLSGLSRRAARARASQIREESMLGGDFDRVVSGYSQGMRARLAFAAMARDDCRTLLLDEVHEAFDHEFRAILAERAAGILASGGVVVAAGHDHPLLSTLCPRAVLLADGRIAADGPFEEVRRAYLG